MMIDCTSEQTRRQLVRPGINDPGYNGPRSDRGGK